VDETIVFHGLSEEHLMQIVDIQLERVLTRLAERNIKLQLTDAARRDLVQMGSDPAYGARPLKRAIQKKIETPVGRLLLKGGADRRGARRRTHLHSGVRVDANRPCPRRLTRYSLAAAAHRNGKIKESLAETQRRKSIIVLCSSARNWFSVRLADICQLPKTR
jgi:hypothetical protein